MITLANETREKLGEYKQRGSERLPPGTLFPEVPILTNQEQGWMKLSPEEKGRGLTEFKFAKPKK